MTHPAVTLVVVAVAVGTEGQSEEAVCDRENAMIKRTFIALKPDGNRITLTVTVTPPEQDERDDNGDFYCRVEIPELSVQQRSYGIDALQALCLVNPCLRSVFVPLIDQGWTFYLPEDPSEALDLLACYFPAVEV